MEILGTEIAQLTIQLIFFVIYIEFTEHKMYISTINRYKSTKIDHTV